MSAEVPPTEQPTGLVRRLEFSAAMLFAGLSGVTAYLHEPWADEANSWLLGRDATLVELWTRLMHYEGTPALWHTLLHILIHLGFPYSGINFLSGLFGCGAAWIFIRRAPFPTAIRLAMPLTFYLFYQYSIVARSYCLLPVLLFVCAVLYREPARRTGWITLLLCLMAGISAHGMLISGAIWASLQWELWRASRKRQIVLGAVYVVVVLLLAWSAFPAKDANFMDHGQTSLADFLDAEQKTLANSFTGEWISSLALIGISLPVLWRGRGLAMFLMAGLGICLFNGLVYANLWHQGILFLTWLFAMWISVNQTKIGRFGIAAMVLVVLIHGYWGARTTWFDWNQPYSGAKAAAAYLKKTGITGSRLMGFGFACVGIQPYFKSNIFPNFGDGGKRTYFDWSDALVNFSDGEQLAELKPEFAIVGYKDEEEKEETRLKVRGYGYRLIKNFDGHLYWHDKIQEPDAFDLYQRN